MEKTRFTANGKPVYKTRIGSLVFSHPDGQKEEVYGMGPIALLTDMVDVLDEPDHVQRGRRGRWTEPRAGWLHQTPPRYCRIACLPEGNGHGARVCIAGNPRLT